MMLYSTLSEVSAKFKFVFFVFSLLSLFIQDLNAFTGLEVDPLLTDAGVLGNIGAEVGQVSRNTG